MPDKAKDVGSAPADCRWGAIRRGPDDWSLHLWAPSAHQVTARVAGRDLAMVQDGDGFWTTQARANSGDRYSFVVDGVQMHDPAARAQAGALDGASVLHDPGAHPWQTDWRGRPWRDLVILEIHIGTFTSQGTFRSAIARLQDVADAGITAIELMPVAHAPGGFGWGYDGVLPFAPHPAYGTPDEMRAFIDRAHALGLCVLLDVVFNHFGPQDASVLACIPEFTGMISTPWGSGFAFQRPGVRRYFTECALMWLTEYRLDGLRIDAVHQMHDDTDLPVLEEIAQSIRSAKFDRPIHLVTEDERNDPSLHEKGLIDGQWNDDYHHALHVLLTGEAEGYYAPFAADPLGDLARALTEGFAGQGQDERLGHPSAHLPQEFFVNANQTHDQVGNRALGERLVSLVGDDAARVAHALLLTGPATPMLFMGEERGETAPFRYFADYTGPLGRMVRDGRRHEMAAFTGFAAEDLPDPTCVTERNMSCLGWADDGRARGWLDLTRQLLTLRRTRLLPIYRSGTAGRATARQIGPRNLHIRWPYRNGTVEVWLSLGTSLCETPAMQQSLLSIGDPVRDLFSIAVGLSR